MINGIPEQLYVVPKDMVFFSFPGAQIDDEVLMQLQPATGRSRAAWVKGRSGLGESSPKGPRLISLPIGSMVLVYMPTFGVYWW